MVRKVLFLSLALGIVAVSVVLLLFVKPSFNVEFRDEDATLILQVDVKKGEDALPPDNPSKVGYTFSGWDAEYSNIEADLVITATYTINSYTIRFQMDGGSSVSAITQIYLTAVAAPAAPTKTGYAFGGWYSNEALTTPYVFSIMPAEDVDLYAKWTVNQVTLSFDSNGGAAVDPITQNYGTAVAAPTAPTKVGHTFGGWYSNEALTTLYVFSTMPAQSITLYAKWTIIAYTVTFEDHDGTVLKTESVDYGFNATAPNNPTRPNYTFGGWDVGYTNVTGNLTVTATYVINQYTITFQSNGATAVDPITQNYGTAVAAPTAPTKVGHTFGGWYSNEALTTLYVFSTMPAQSITLYAKWTIIAYTVTFENHDGTVLKTESVDYGFNATAPNNPTRVGYTFLQWSASYADITANLTVTATYVINQYTITFQSNGATAVDPITQNYGTAVAAPTAPTKVGHTFGGWYSNEALTTLYVFSTMPAQSITLYAKWTIIQYTVTFINFDESVLKTQTVNHGSAATAPNNPTRPNYTFGGWDVGYTNVTGNLTVTATYTINQYTITFQTNGGSAITAITQDFGSAVNAPADPTRNTDTFAGWYSNVGLTTTYAFTTMPNQNITIYAKWYSGGLAYTLIDGGTHYSVSRGTATGHIFIPTMYNGLPVTAIAANGFDRFGQSWVFSSLTLSEGLTTIGADALRSYPLTSIALPSTLVTIGNTAFAFCGLTSIYLPVGVTGISEQMFSSCGSLQTITVDVDNPNLTSLDGVLFNDDMTTLIAYPNANTRTTYTVPASVTTVAAYSFRQFGNLQHLIFQTGLTTIAQYAITSSTSLLTLYLPLSVTTIAGNGIWNCTNVAIHVAASEKPVGWNANWNASNRPVIWSYVN
jgi:uncharacterized repeat protein (TIGR02543 family)